MRKLLVLFFVVTTLNMVGMSEQPNDVPFVTTGMDEGKKQQALINALEIGDKARILQLLAGIDINKPFGLFGFRGFTPLSLVAVGKFSPWETSKRAEREEIARFLISKGADVADLNEYLLPAVKRGEIDQVKFLLALGAQDVNNQALNYAIDERNHYMEHKYDRAEIEKLGQIVRLLENAKKGVVKLKPTAKPAPAKPKGDDSSQPPLATRPVRLAPVTRPAQAIPAEDRSGQIRQFLKEKQLQEQELAAKKAQESKTYVSDAAVLIGIAGGQSESYEQRNIQKAQIQEAMPQEAPVEEPRRVYAR